MGVLLLGPGGELGPAIVQRLASQGDDVRVVTEDAQIGDASRSLGARVARGPATDADLVERAAQGVRSIVIFDDPSTGSEVAAAALEAARLAGTERVIVVCGAANDAAAAAVIASSVEHVVIVTGGPGGPLRFSKRRVESFREKVAEAVDAADDLAGHPRMVVDVYDPGSLASLNL